MAVDGRLRDTIFAAYARVLCVCSQLSGGYVDGDNNGDNDDNDDIEGTHTHTINASHCVCLLRLSSGRVVPSMLSDIICHRVFDCGASPCSCCIVLDT